MCEGRRKGGGRRKGKSLSHLIQLSCVLTHLFLECLDEVGRSCDGVWCVGRGDVGVLQHHYHVTMPPRVRIAESANKIRCDIVTSCHYELSESALNIGDPEINSPVSIGTPLNRIIGLK